MRAFKRFIALLYFAAALFVLGGFAGLMFGPYRGRFESLFERMPARVALIVCLIVMALGVLVAVCRLVFTRREPTCVRPAGNPDIEVTLAALESCARTAAASGEDVMIERVRGRLTARDASAVHFEVEAIAFTDHGLDQVARRMQERVEAACAEMLGTATVSARVRFLPAKTTTVTKEVSRERD